MTSRSVARSSRGVGRGRAGRRGTTAGAWRSPSENVSQDWASSGVVPTWARPVQGTWERVALPVPPDGPMSAYTLLVEDDGTGWRFVPTDPVPGVPGPEPDLRALFDRVRARPSPASCGPASPSRPIPAGWAWPGCPPTTGSPATAGSPSPGATRRRSRRTSVRTSPCARPARPGPRLVPRGRPPPARPAPGGGRARRAGALRLGVGGRRPGRQRAGPGAPRASRRAPRERRGAHLPVRLPGPPRRVPGVPGRHLRRVLHRALRRRYRDGGPGRLDAALRARLPRAGGAGRPRGPLPGVPRPPQPGP